MAREKNTDERRTQIARGLLKVLGESSYEQATIRDVARAAKVPAGTVHYHFKNKAEILPAALDLLVAEHLRELDAALAGGKHEPIEQLRRFINFHVSNGVYDPRLAIAWLFMGHEALRDLRFQKKYLAAIKKWRERLLEILRWGEEKKVFRTPDVEAVATALLAAIQGYTSFGHTSPRGEIVPETSGYLCVQAMASGLLNTKI